MALLIAPESCAGYHAISGGGRSPNPEGPAFGKIVSRTGVTLGELAGWLRDGHNYPTEMGFHLEPRQIDSLVAYMIRGHSEVARQN